MISKITVGNTYIYNNEPCVVIKRKSGSFEVVVKYNQSHKEETISAAKFREEAHKNVR